MHALTAPAPSSSDGLNRPHGHRDYRPCRASPSGRTLGRTGTGRHDPEADPLQRGSIARIDLTSQDGESAPGLPSSLSASHDASTTRHAPQSSAHCAITVLGMREMRFHNACQEWSSATRQFGPQRLHQGRDPRTARLADQRRAEDRRLSVQSTDPRLSFEPVGGTAVIWNDAEWLNSHLGADARDLRHREWTLPEVRSVVVRCA